MAAELGNYRHCLSAGSLTGFGGCFVIPFAFPFDHCSRAMSFFPLHVARKFGVPSNRPPESSPPPPWP